VAGSYHTHSFFSGVSLTGGGYYLVKYDSTGTFHWIRHTTGGANPRSVSVDKNDELLVSGYLVGSGSTVFHSPVNNITLNKSKTNESFVVKYFNNGDLKWAIIPNGIANAWDYNTANSIACDNHNNAYITGYYKGQTIFGPSTLTGEGGYFAKLKDTVPGVVTSQYFNQKVTDLFILYPSPTAGFFQIKSLKHRITSCRISNSLGQQVYCSTEHGNGDFTKDFDFTGMPKGIYFVEIRSAELREVRKLLLE
jgi:hypothetical protein